MADLDVIKIIFIENIASQYDHHRGSTSYQLLLLHGLDDKLRTRKQQVHRCVVVAVDAHKYNKAVEKEHLQRTESKSRVSSQSESILA